MTPESLLLQERTLQYSLLNRLLLHCPHYRLLLRHLHVHHAHYPLQYMLHSHLPIDDPVVEYSLVVDLLRVL